MKKTKNVQQDTPRQHSRHFGWKPGGKRRIKVAALVVAALAAALGLVWLIAPEDKQPQADEPLAEVDAEGRVSLADDGVVEENAETNGLPDEEQAGQVAETATTPLGEGVTESTAVVAVVQDDGEYAEVVRESASAKADSRADSDSQDSSSSNDEWPLPEKSRYLGETLDYRVVELPPTEKGGKPGELREWLIKPDEGYTAHIEEEYRPDEEGELQVVDAKEYVANQVLLTLDGETDFDAFRNTLEKSGAIVKLPLMELEKGAKIVAVMLPDASFDAVEALNEAIVAYDARLEPERDLIAHIDRTPNDTRYSSLWGMTKIQAPEAWNTRTDASSVVVAVLDTGVNYTHEDLAANMWVNPSQGTFSGVSGDRYGIRSIGGVLSGDPRDDHSHGSNCAGIIGAVGNNSKGVVGVAWTTKIMALKWLNASGGGALTDLLNCLNYARTKGANIVSCSFWYDYSASLYNAYAALRTSGIIAVCSAGNDAKNTDVYPQYPSCLNLDNVVSVAATTSADSLASFSNFGAASVDIAAPGYSIYSCGYASSTAYTTMSGTSQAAPHVAGALALLKAQYPSYTYLQLIQKLYAGGDSVAELSGKCTTGKRLNIYKALSSPTPSAPTPSATRGAYSDRVVVSWSSVSGASYYRVYRATSSTGTKTALGSWQTGTSYADTSVTANTTYYYWVCAATSSSGANQSTFGSYATGYAQPATGDSWDPGDNTASGGTTITPSTSRQTHGTHTLNGADLYDFFKVSMTAGTTYTFETTGLLDTYGELFNSTSTNSSYRVAYNDDGGTNTNFRIQYTPTASGTYYLRVRAYSVGNSGSYTLAYQRSAARDSWDPTDDNASGGTLIMPTTTIQTHGPHTLSSDDSYDFFRISMTAGRKYTFESTGSYDIYGELFSSTSTNASYRVAYDDDGGDSLNFKLEYTPTTSQTYYLRVRRFSVGTDGSYSLKYSYIQNVQNDIGFCNYGGWPAPAFLTASTNAMSATTTFYTNQTVWVCFQSELLAGTLMDGPVTNCAKIVNNATGATRYTYQSIWTCGYESGYYSPDTLPISGLEAGSYTARIALNEDWNGNHKASETTYTNNVRTISFTVANPQKTLSSIAISGNAAIVSKGSADYRCVGTYSDGSTADVSPTWSITSGSTYASVNSSGRVTAGDTTIDRSITLRATFGGKTATKVITVSGVGAVAEDPFPSDEPVTSQLVPKVVEGQVFIDNVAAVAGDVLAAYVGTEFRRKARIAANGMVRIAIPRLSDRETISFKVWDASEGDSGMVYDCAQTLTSTSTPEGSQDSPYRIDAVSGDGFGEVTLREDIATPIIVEASVTVDGVPAANGDMLAAFSGTSIAGKQPLQRSGSGSSGSATDAARCRLLMRFAPPRSLTFKLWRKDNGQILECAAPLNVNSTTPVGTAANPYQIAFTSGNDMNVPCRVSLETGWNLVSFSVLPASPTPANVFSEVAGSIRYVNPGNESSIWSPTDTGNEIGMLQIGKGYWVFADSAAEWTVEGTAEPDKVISLSPGWNCIGYTLPRAGRYEDVMRTALASGKVRYVINDRGRFAGSDFMSLAPGKGYWLYLERGSTYQLVFDQSGMASSSAYSQMLSDFDDESSDFEQPFGQEDSSEQTPKVIDVFRVTLFGKPAAFGDVVAAYYRGIDDNGVDTNYLATVKKIESEDGTCRMALNHGFGNYFFRIWNAASGLDNPEIFDGSSDYRVGNTTPVDSYELNITGNVPTYAVTYDLDGKATRTGGGALVQTVSFGGDAVDPVISVNAGWQFVDWDIGRRTDVRAPLAIKALYEEVSAPTYTITYDPGDYGAESQQTATKTHDVALTLAGAIFTRAGYSQTGWYRIDDDGGIAVWRTYSLADSYGDNANATFYPYWEANEYAVSFDRKGGQGGPDDTNATYAAAMPAITPPTREGHTFGGYFDAENGGGTQYYDASGASAHVWDKAGTATLYAKWTVNFYTVTFDAGEGTGGWSSPLDYGAELSPPSVTWTGHEFKRWMPDVPATVPVGGGTYVAQWDTLKFSITIDPNGGAFDASGGTAATTELLDYGSEILVPTVSRTGYELTGWSPALPATASADTTYAAQWSPRTYGVTLDARGGSGGSPNVTATYDAPMPPITVPVSSTQAFRGYFTEIGGAGTQYYDAFGNSAHVWDVASDGITLYAFWENVATLSLSVGKFGKAQVEIGGESFQVGPDVLTNIEVSTDAQLAVRVTAQPGAGFAMSGGEAEYAWTPFTANQNVSYAFIPQLPGATLDWKFSKAIGRYFAQVKIPAHAGYAEALAGLSFIFADRANGGDAIPYAQLWDAAARAPFGVMVTDNGVDFRGVALGEGAFAGAADGDSVVFGVSDATLAAADQAVPASERQIGLFVRMRVSPVSGNETSGEVDNFLGYLSWTTEGTRYFLPIVGGADNGAVATTTATMLSSLRRSSALPVATRAYLPATLGASRALGLAAATLAAEEPKARIAEFNVGADGSVSGRVEAVAGGERSASFGTTATVCLLAAESLGGEWAEVASAEVDSATGMFTIPADRVGGGRFFKAEIDVEEIYE